MKLNRYTMDEGINVSRYELASKVIFVNIFVGLSRLQTNKMKGKFSMGSNWCTWVKATVEHCWFMNQHWGIYVVIQVM